MGWVGRRGSRAWDEQCEAHEDRPPRTAVGSYEVVLGIDEPIDLLAPEIGDVVKFYAQRKLCPLFLIPIVLELHIAQGQRPLLVELVGENRLDLSVRVIAAQKVLADETDRPMIGFRDRAEHRANLKFVLAGTGMRVELDFGTEAP